MVVQHVRSVDNRLVPVTHVDEAWLKTAGLRWFGIGDNADYLADAAVRLDQSDLLTMRNAARDAYDMLIKCCEAVVQQNLWNEFNIPASAQRLIKWSLENERHLHVAGRFDFAGGLEGVPIKLLEFNADTYSLLAETVKIQPRLLNMHGQRNQHQWSYQTFDHLVAHFRSILQRYTDREPTLLVTDLGNTEDRLNLSIIEEAAQAAGFKKVTYMPLEKIVFSEGEGVFVEISRDDFIQYDFMYKMVPWDFILFEEPELFDLLDNLIMNDLCVIMNPAFTMLMQSKGILPIMARMFPYDGLVLKASARKNDLAGQPHVCKPLYGRTGDNVQLFKANESVSYYENDGDYGHFPMIYQEMATLNEDSEMYIYQPSVYAIGGQPSGICLRRQDDLVIDDDAEFVAHLT